MKYQSDQRGIALLITLLIMTVLLGVSASLLNITLKQYRFSSIGLQSEVAFQAANAGMECLLYHDFLAYPASKFDVPSGSGIARESGVLCMNTSSNDLYIAGNAGLGIVADAQANSGEEQRFQFSWGTGSNQVCSDVSVYKYFHATVAQDMVGSLGRTLMCAAGATCTVIKSRGYNTSCANITQPRTIERELIQKY